MFQLQNLYNIPLQKKMSAPQTYTYAQLYLLYTDYTESF